jgi:hypothetical protein
MQVSCDYLTRIIGSADSGVLKTSRPSGAVRPLAPRVSGLLQESPIGLRDRIWITHAVGPVRGLDP